MYIIWFTALSLISSPCIFLFPLHLVFVSNAVPFQPITKLEVFRSIHFSCVCVLKILFAKKAIKNTRFHVASWLDGLEQLHPFGSTLFEHRQTQDVVLEPHLSPSQSKSFRWFSVSLLHIQTDKNIMYFRLNVSGVT